MLLILKEIAIIETKRWLYGLEKKSLVKNSKEANIVFELIQYTLLNEFWDTLSCFVFKNRWNSSVLGQVIWINHINSN